MTESKMKQAGEISRQFKFTDEELALAIKGTELALAYLAGKGLHWELAIRPLRLELQFLRGFMEARKKDK